MNIKTAIFIITWLSASLSFADQASLQEDRIKEYVQEEAAAVSMVAQQAQTNPKMNTPEGREALDEQKKMVEKLQAQLAAGDYNPEDYGLSTGRKQTSETTSSDKTASGDDNGKFYGQLVHSAVVVRKTLLHFFVDHRKELSQGSVEKRLGFAQSFPWKKWAEYKKMESGITKVAGDKNFPDYFLTYGAKIFRKLEEPEVKNLYGDGWSKEVEDAVLSHFEQDKLSDYSLDDFDAKKDAGLTESTLPLPKPSHSGETSTAPKNDAGDQTSDDKPTPPPAKPDVAGDVAKHLLGF